MVYTIKEETWTVYANFPVAIINDSYRFRLQSSHLQAVYIRNMKGNYIPVCIKVIRRTANAPVFMNVILLRRDKRHVSANRVVIFRPRSRPLIIRNYMQTTGIKLPFIFLHTWPDVGYCVAEICSRQL